MKTRVIQVLLVSVALTFAFGRSALAAPSEAAPSPDQLERDHLTGDWGGARTWLQDHGITLDPRLTQFYQGLAAGDDENSFRYGGKLDLLLKADLGKLGFWDGLSMTIHGEYNFGNSVNGQGGTLAPVNTALFFPGIEGSAAIDLSSVYLQQRFGDSASLVLGKINMIDFAASKPFMGGAGIDSFWNITFTAPPSGTVPPYLFGVIMSVRTEPATFGLWVYDPVDVVNRTGLEDPFADGVTVRVSVDFPVTLADLRGHQGFAASYSTLPGTDLEDLNDTLIPPYPSGTPGIKDSRYYFAYSFDQYLYQSAENPKEGVGLFGQFGLSDGNPNRLYWSALAGVGGTGLIPGRSRDNWGFGYYYYGLSPDLKDALAPIQKIHNEQGMELFYNAAMTPSVTVGANLQVIRPGLGETTAVFPGVRMMIRF
ncbi:MAG: carbohydrate porin [Candidatus Manganitrophus sp.]|nr:MAG: carbohydrate porin [Candidatus Manganitrophus sp.]